MNKNNHDNNTEAVKIANALKPFAKKWFDKWGKSCLRSKKMTVSTAPNGTVIGVKDAFSDTEIFIKYMSECSNAQVGDTVWCKWMYDNMQTLYADSMGNLVPTVDYVPTTGGTFTGDVTFNGVLDVTQRRCYATLSSAVWYRVCTTRDIAGTIIEFSIGRPYGANPAEAHRVSFYVVGGGKSSFVDETSISNTLGIDKIRATYGGGVIHIDVHYSLSTSNEVLVYFDVSGKGEQNGTTVSNGLQSVADAPSGETVLTTYEFAANTMQQSVTIPYSQFASSNGTIWGTESHVKLVWDNKKVVITGYILLQNPASGILTVDFPTPAGFPYNKFNGNWLIVGQAYRRSGSYMQPCDFVYGIINSSRIRFAERNVFSSHPASDYAMITIPTATYYFD